MERKSILISQKEVVKNWRGDFHTQPCDEGIRYVYRGVMTVQSYCEFLRMDYLTVCLLGMVSYAIEYNCIEGNKYVLKCETFIGDNINEKLSFELEDEEDYLGFYEETNEGVGKAQWLPSNWKELITDEQLHDILQERNIQTIECLNDDDVPDEMKERIAKDWCANHSDELENYLDETDKMTIAYNYIAENPYDSGSEVVKYIGNDDAKDLIKDLVDNL